MDNLKKYIINKRDGQTPTEKVVGLGKTEDFSAFGKNHADEIELLREAFLLDFCDNTNFTDDQLKYFRMGLDLFPSFFKSCVSDVHKKQTKGTDF